MCLRTSVLGPTLVLSIGKQVMAAARAVVLPSLSKQKIQKAKDLIPTKSKEKVSEKEKAPSKAKRKTTEPPAEGSPKKKLLALTIGAANRAGCGIFISFFEGNAISIELC